jgi:hypothetical protein
LVLLNDPQHVEAARHAAQRMLLEGGKDRQEQVAWLFRSVTSRRPTFAEVQVLLDLFSEQLELFVADESAAKHLIAIGESKADPNMNSAELAAATILAQAILNHDDAVHER